MKIVKDNTRTDGKRIVTLQLDPGETLQVLKPGVYYRLGYPCEDVVPEHVLSDAMAVTWCPIEQKWTA